MKISTSTGTVFRRFGDDYTFFRMVRKAGFRYVDISFYEALGDPMTPFALPHWEKHIDEMGNEMAKIGVTPIICHSPKGEPTVDAGILPRSIRAIECAGRLGIPDMVIHVGGKKGWTLEQFNQFNRHFVEGMLPMAEKNNVRILIENVGRWDEPFYVQSGRELLEFVEYMNHPLVEACLDTGHLSLMDDDNPMTIRLLGNHLKGLHIQDNLGSFNVPTIFKAWRQDLHMPVGFGTIDFDAVVHALADIGYQGSFNTEIEYPRSWGKTFDGCAFPRVAYMAKDLVQEHFAWVHQCMVELLTANGVEAE